jgi:BirA family transcriptional regulator, biotin operon repressor / biotin---[acetyl-CoA-carboxylase] ligase
MAEIIGKTIIKFESLDSTNNYATSQLSKSNLTEGTVILAEEQLSGRGQRDNSWESAKSENLLFSIVLYPSVLPVKYQFLISKVIALGVCDILSLYVENVSIKWPNDIYVGDKKIAGILIENFLSGYNIDSSIAGIGININQQKFYSNAPNPVSLSQLTAIYFDKEELLDLFLNSIDRWYLLLKNKEVTTIDTEYLSRMYRIDIESLYKDNGGEFVGRIAGVNPIGQLVVEKEKGELKEYHFKEIEFLFK